ncbi:hypothetical protein BCR39DRAFT_541678 [Naematelia encephala]|uniref:RRM domain-containing protein n=1 Tax=Naematelia encephala TaxID=71784 RepID=A0A1Y2AVE3_9TREE|nr:hypothetical protein BCR39DRAFT_541678 [Naematelia encephala]
MPAPLPGRFDEDPRVHFDKTAGNYQYEDEETGKEYEWNGKVWIELVDEEQWRAQQAAYSIAGVDESTPANAVVAREERRNKKRKKGEAGPSYKASSISASTSAPQPPSAPKRTAVFVSNLPPTTTAAQLASVFSKAGVLMLGDDGEPRIKLYHDDAGNFKGEALVMFFKEGSVDLAITLLDDTELELGTGWGNIRVKEAEYGSGQGQGQGQAEEKKNGDAAEADGAKKAEKKKLTAEEKQRISKRIKTMQNKVTWHSDDDSDDPAAPIDGAPAPGANRMNRVVVLKGMFSVEDVEKDPGLLLELKEDVREEAETLGTVTSVQLYDQEEDGVMTIKFKDAVSAQACVMKMNGRFFDGRQIFAGIYSGKERYRKSGGGGLGDDDEEEQDRLEGFASWLVDDDGEPN